MERYNRNAPLMGGNRSRGSGIAPFIILLGILLFVFTLLARCQASMYHDTLKAKLVLKSCRGCILTQKEGYVVAAIYSYPGKNPKMGEIITYLDHTRKNLPKRTKVYKVTLMNCDSLSRRIIIPPCP